MLLRVQLRVLRVVLRVRLRHPAESCLRLVWHDASSAQKSQGTVDIGQRDAKRRGGGQQEVDTHRWKW